jgi:hypothetical protein
MTRREFALSTSALVVPAGRPAAELTADVVIIGGGLGGCAAALGAVREGATVLMTEETDWVGGQLTAQCVPPDEHKYIEESGRTALYGKLRDDLRALARKKPKLTAAARSNPRFNPGSAWVSRVSAEPKDWLTVLEAMLAPHVAGGKLRILREWTPVSAEVQGDAVKAVTGRTKDGTPQTVTGTVFIDATELGDLLPMTGTEFVTGSESQRDTGEPSAGPEARPNNIQSFTHVFALEHVPGDDFTIRKPEEYAFWRDYKPALKPPPKAKMMSWLYNQRPDGTPQLGFDPENDQAKWGQPGFNLWTYRRVVDHKHYEKGSGVRDVSLINWGQNDYHGGPIINTTPEEAEANKRRAKQQALSLLYWLQTEAPRPDGKVGYPGLRLRPDISGTADGFAKSLYIRESRRLRAEFTVVEQMVSTFSRKRAEQFPDTVGVGLYLKYFDLHATCGGDNSKGGKGEVLPFQIPLGALLPVRVTNLLAACKNLGVTHVTNGCYRLHVIEWNIGESAGAAAAFAVARKVSPKQVRSDKALLADFQKRLADAGVQLAWPEGATA